MKDRKNKKRSIRVRKKLKSVNKNRYRLSVHRSNRNILAQIIDDKTNKVLASASSLEKAIKDNSKDKKKSDLSVIVGETLAKRANEKKINKLFFDRGKYKYHGRIKTLTESLRKNGLNI